MAFRKVKKPPSRTIKVVAIDDINGLIGRITMVMEHDFVADQNALFSCQKDQMFGNRNVLFLIIGALIVVVGVLGYNLYQDKRQPEGLQINVGPNGVKIQGK